MALPYIPTTWLSGDIVSSARLNKLEGGVKENSDAILENTADVNQLKSQIEEIVSVDDLFSINAISASTNPIWYNYASTSRVALKNGIFLYLKAGQKVSMATAGTRCLLGIYIPATGTWKYAGWINNPYPYTLTDDGLYTVVMSRQTEQTEESVSYLVSALRIDGKPIDKRILTDHIGVLKQENYAYQTVPGFIAADGSIAGQSATEQEVTTEYIAAKQGVIFEIVYTSPTAKSGWLAIGEYGEGDTFIRRNTVTCNEAQFTTFFAVTDSRTKYLRFSWRTYGIVSVEIRVINSLAYAADFIHDLDNGIGYLNANSVSTNVNSINHRGYNSAPENTIPAFKLSKRNGFSSVEVDVRFTSDGTAVLLHDESINRTARNADGTELSETVNIADITYEDALDYDFGIYKGSAYEGTKIPTFEEAMTLFRALGIRPYIELKAGTQAQIEGLVDTVLACGMSGKVTWVSFTDTFLGYIKTADDAARIGYLVNSINATAITTAQGLKTTSNEVFIDSHTYSDSEIALCVAAKLPLEVWTINNATTIAALDPYITGVTSDTVIAAYALMLANLG